MMKLRPKDTSTSNIVSLTSVAEMLKNKPTTAREEQKEVNVEPITVRSEVTEIVHKESRRVNEIVRETKFNEILEEIENKEYECTGVIYIDEQIKEVLSLLKSKGKIKTSSLVSFILEQFLEENKEDINTILRSSNRFLG